MISVGKNQTYRMIKDGTYPLPVRENNGRFTVSKWDLLAYLHVPGYYQPEQAQAAGGGGRLGRDGAPLRGRGRAHRP